MNYKHIKEIIENEFSLKTIMVIGDLMVDRYIIGKVQRISPEAPVPVLNYHREKMEAGGASNVAHNLKTLGCKVIISGVIADDEAGEWLRKHLYSVGINTEGIVFEENRLTTMKTRYITGAHQLLRVDKELTDSIKEETQNVIFNILEKNMNSIDGVVLSDYKKGVLSDIHFVERIIDICRDRGIPILIDSKSRNISAFRNADFVKPNNLELEEAVGIHIIDNDTLNHAGEVYLRESGVKNLIVTRGANGISLFRTNMDRVDFPAPEVQVFDVTGAGDTVMSIITLASACGISIEESIELANIAAGIVISKIGTAAVTAKELVGRIDD